MSTEQKPATPPAPPPKQEPNALASGLSDAWVKFKGGQLLSYPLMALILLLVAGVVGGWWFLHERSKAASARWREWNAATSVAELQKLTEQKEYANTTQARLANLEIARIHLGPEGIERMFVKSTDFQQMDPAEAEKRAREMREAAVTNVEKAREEFTKLADDFKDDPVIRVECLYACAKAEAVLVGIPKAGQVTERRGDPKKAVEWLDKVAEAAPDTEWGKSAKKLADSLRNQNTEQQVATLQASLFDISPDLPRPKLPGLPGLPSMPGLPPGHP